MIVRNGGHDVSRTEATPKVGQWAPQLTHTDPNRTVREAERDNEASFSVQPFKSGGWIGMPLLCHIILDDVNVILLQHAPNFLDIIHIYAGNTNATLNPAVKVLNDFKLKRDAVQTKNDFPAQ